MTGVQTCALPISNAVVMLDGGSSIAMAYRDPVIRSLKVKYAGGKHSYFDTVAVYRVNNYLLFKCKKPR